MFFSTFCQEFVDKGKDITVVFAQETTEVRDTFRVNLLICHNAARTGEGFVDLSVQLFPIGDDDKGPVTWNFPENFLGEEQHRDALSTALCMPKHAELTAIGFNAFQGFNGVVHAQVLMILGSELYCSALRTHKEGEVLNDVNQPAMAAESTQNGFQRNRRGFIFTFNAFPFREVFPTGGEAADAALRTVGEDYQALYQNRWGMVSL